MSAGHREVLVDHAYCIHLPEQIPTLDVYSVVMTTFAYPLRVYYGEGAWCTLIIILKTIVLFAACLGHEKRIEECAWDRRQMGSGVCDRHPNLGIRHDEHQWRLLSLKKHRVFT